MKCTRVRWRLACSLENLAEKARSSAHSRVPIFPDPLPRPFGTLVQKSRQDYDQNSSSRRSFVPSDSIPTQHRLLLTCYSSAQLGPNFNCERTKRRSVSSVRHAAARSRIVVSRRWMQSSFSFSFLKSSHFCEAIHQFNLALHLHLHRLNQVGAAVAEGLLAVAEEFR